MGALSGDYASIGTPILQGIQYAVDQVNKSGDLACTLKLDKEDSQGNPDQAPALAHKIASNDNVVAVVGPYFSGETLASGPIFNSAKLPFITPSATDPSLAQQGWTYFFRAVPNDAAQGPVAAEYIEKALKASSAVTIDDNSQYGKGLAAQVAKKLGSVNKGSFHIDPNSTDYSSTIAQVKSLNPDVVYYGGYSPQAGPLAKQLKQQGVAAQFMSDDGTKDPTFGKLAGPAATGVLVTCPCADPTKLPAASSFVKGMQQTYGQPPGTYAADAYDVVQMIGQALKNASSSDSGTDLRATVEKYFQDVNGYQGITKTYTFDSHGEVEVDPLRGVWVYKWSNSDKNFVALGYAGQLLK